MESPEGNGSNPPLISISTLLKQSDSAGADDTTKRVRGESLCSNLHELGEPMLELGGESMLDLQIHICKSCPEFYE